MGEAWLMLGEETLPESPEIEGSKRTWERAFYMYRDLVDLCCPAFFWILQLLPLSRIRAQQLEIWGGRKEAAEERRS